MIIISAKDIEDIATANTDDSLIRCEKPKEFIGTSAIQEDLENISSVLFVNAKPATFPYNDSKPLTEAIFEPPQPEDLAQGLINN